MSRSMGKKKKKERENVPQMEPASRLNLYVVVVRVYQHFFLLFK